MRSSLLVTKISVPRLRPGLVARPDLIERLQAGLERPLTLVSAPAGYGKTTLLAALAERVPAAWLTLDEGDNDPVGFWSHFTAALQVRQPRLGAGVLQMLVSPELPPVRSLLVELINEISVSLPADQPQVIILDDYHNIDEQGIHRDLSFLLENLPRQLRLVISTRTDPPLPLARLRARGQVVEFRARELRFNLEETETLLNGVAGLGLSRENIATLETRTEGWIASLQMAAISMRQREDVPAFIAAFTGTHRHVVDYLVEEVLDRQTPGTRLFLVETSALRHLNGALCDAVTGRAGGADLLERLDRANLFLVPLDEERKWYRYHHLFSTLLAEQLRREQPGRNVELQKKAARWCRDNGLASEAISYAMEAGDFDLAARILEPAGAENLVRLEYRTLLKRLEWLPEKTVLEHPVLGVYYAFLLAKMGNIDGAEDRLDRVEGRPLTPSSRARAVITRAHITVARREDARTIELLTGVAESGEPIGDIAADPEAQRSLALRIYAGFLLTFMHKAQGRPRIAAVTCRNVLDNFTSLPIKPPWSVLLGWLHVTAAELLYEQNKLEDAACHVAAGLEFAAQAGNQSLRSYALTVFELVRQAKGEDGVAAPGEDTDFAGAGESCSCYPTMTLPLQLRLLFARGDFGGIVRLVRSYRQAADMEEWRAMSRAYPGDPMDVALAYADLAAGNAGAAGARLETLQARAEGAGRNGNLVEILLVRALAHSASGESAKAGDLLRRSLVIAEPEGYFRIFVDLGAPLAGLLKQIALTDTDPHYVRRVLAEFKSNRSGLPDLAQPLVEPLTPREREMLKLFAAGLSNQEIAGKLVLTVGTVKAHAHHIYAKLGVSNRTRAVKKAIDLKLV
jgi:LuxR family maltose regulon positive regulatory protein